MSKNKKIYEFGAFLLIALLSIIFGRYLFGFGESVFVLPFISGIFFVFVIKEKKSYKYLKSLIIASFLYAVIFGLSIFRVHFFISNWWTLPSKDHYLLILVFAFLFFLGGGTGIVFKGFYSLYKKMIDKLIIFVGPVILVIMSSFVRSIDMGGTIMNRYYGWPKPFLSYQIKDILDGFLISNWVFDRFFINAIYNYLIFLAVFSFLFFVINYLNKHFKKLKLNSTPIIFSLILLGSAVFLVSSDIHKSYVQHEINKANYCEADSDCRHLEPKCPFGCAIYVNKNESARINGLLSRFDSNCVYSCIATIPKCEFNKCRVVFEKNLSLDIEQAGFENNNPETIINSLKISLNNSSLDTNFKEKDSPYLWWISDDGWNIIDDSAFEIISTDPISNLPNPYSSPLDATTKELNESLSEIFLDNDFSINNLNTSESETDKSFYDYIVAFEKEDTRCIIKINRDNWEYSISCSDEFQKAYDEQIPYLKGLDIKDGVITKIEKIGNFARLSIRHRRTGHFKIIKIVGDEMIEIFRGQEPPRCKLMIENQVPEEIYERCFDESFYTQ